MVIYHEDHPEKGARTMRVTLHTNLLKNGSIDGIAGARPARFDMEIVAGIQLANQPVLHFRHGVMGSDGKGSEVIDFPEPMAKRLLEFCKDYYVNRIGDFDCCSFVFAIMGWKGGQLKGRTPREIEGPLCGHETTKNAKPYATAPKIDERPGHYLMGISRRGHSLSVGGVNQPLIIAQNGYLTRAYNSSSLIQIQKLV